MAIIYSDQYTLRNSGELIPVSDWGGKIRIMNFNFIALGTLQIGDFIYLVKLPPGRVIFYGSLSWKAYFNSAEGDLYIGWGNYKSPANQVVAGTIDGIDRDEGIAASVPVEGIMGSEPGIKANGRDKVFESSTGIDIVVSSDITISAGNYIRGHIAYTLD